MKKTWLLGLFLWGAGSVFAQDTLHLKEMKRVAESLQMPQVFREKEYIVSPQVPEGYVLELKGSDRLPVVDATGHIGKVLADSPVRLYYQLKDKRTGESVDVTHLQVVVPADGKAAADANPCPQVIPALQEWKGEKGELVLSGKGRIVIDSQNEQDLKQGAAILAGDLHTLFGLDYSVESGKPAAGDIFLTLATTDKQLGEEGYRMKIGEIVTIEALTSRGVFWGTRTLLQMAEHHNLHLYAGEIRDYPRYARRGFMLDVGRKFFRLDFLQAYVKIMAYYKMNDFHIHLNDNGFVQFFDNDWDKTYAAFRLESDYFPGLTAKDGFYTKREFTDLQLEGMEYGVNIVPEIDVPAHSLAFSHYRKSLGSEKYGMDHLDLSNPAVYPFLDSLFSEYLSGPSPVFAGPDVHIGTDEYAREEAERFRAFTDHYLKLVQGFGKRARLWGALTHAEGKTPVTSEGVVMNAWYNGYADPKEMIRQGYELISTPDGWLYIVPAAGYYHDYLELEKIYKEWEPIQIGEQHFPAGHPNISGGTFAVWNDHCGNGISEKDVHHRAFPALQVLAQKMWTGKSNADYAGFAALAAKTCEAPGINLMGKVKSVGHVVLDYRFGEAPGKDFSGNAYDYAGVEAAGKNDKEGMVFNGHTVINTPVAEIGYDYTVDIELWPAKDIRQEAVLFQSPDTKVVYTPEHKIGFRRDGYFYTFSYSLQPETWQKVRVEGDARGTALYVNGEKKEHLAGKTRVVKNKQGRESVMYIQQTLVFPLERIGDIRSGFTGRLKNLKVYNRKME